MALDTARSCQPPEGQMCSWSPLARNDTLGRARRYSRCVTTEGNRGCLAALFGQGTATGNKSLIAAETAVDMQLEEPSIATQTAVEMRLRQDFLSITELSFFRAAEIATRGRFTVLTKINLADLFTSPTRDQGDWNRISRKHVDFLLCDAQTLKPLLGIELDDSSHARVSAQRGDAVKDAAFASAGLPLLRVSARRGYATTEISALIDDAIGGRALPVAAEVAAAVQAGTPTCPRCGVPMVLRPGVKGRYDSFYGCVNYPRCRERKLVPSE